MGTREIMRQRDGRMTKRREGGGETKSTTMDKPKIMSRKKYAVKRGRRRVWTTEMCT